jgi:hypothetical protein
VEKRNAVIAEWASDKRISHPGISISCLLSHHGRLLPGDLTAERLSPEAALHPGLTVSRAMS